MKLNTSFLSVWDIIKNLFFPDGYIAVLIFSVVLFALSVLLFLRLKKTQAQPPVDSVASGKSKRAMRLMAEKIKKTAKARTVTAGCFSFLSLAVPVMGILAGQNTKFYYFTLPVCIALGCSAVLCIASLFPLVKKHARTVVVFVVAGGALFATFTAVSAMADYNYDIPVINIVTDSGEDVVSRENYVDAAVSVYNARGKYLFKSADAQVRTRGNVSAYFGEEELVSGGMVPYKIKFSEKRTMLGLNDGNEFKQWVLLREPTNSGIGMDIAQAIVASDGYYNADHKLVEVYINNTFKGMFMLTEQTQVKKNRVDIKEVAEGYTGTDIGYLIEIDNYATHTDEVFYTSFPDIHFVDRAGNSVSIDDRGYTFKNDIYSPAQIAYIKKYVTNIYTIMYEAICKSNYLTLDGEHNLVAFENCRDSYEAVNAVVDVRSLVDMYMLYETCGIGSSGDGSFYLAVDFSPESTVKRLTFLNPWDFDSSCRPEPDEYYSCISYTKEGDSYPMQNMWFLMAAQADWFFDKVSERWQEVYAQTNGFRQVKNNYIYILNNLSSVKRRFKLRFPVLDGGMFDEEDLMQRYEWYLERFLWLNSEWGEN